jgi:hypothetical protein
MLVMAAQSLFWEDLNTWLEKVRLRADRNDSRREYGLIHSGAGLIIYLATVFDKSSTAFLY